MKLGALLLQLRQGEGMGEQQLIAGAVLQLGLGSSSFSSLPFPFFFFLLLSSSLSLLSLFSIFLNVEVCV